MKLRSLERFAVDATDGALGSLINFLFDDERWTVRYLVVETGSFFDRRGVLVSPLSFRSVRQDCRRIELALTCAQIQGSPSVDVDLPVSRQHEADYYEYYGYPPYWGPANPRGIRYVPERGGDPGQMIGDVHLRSAKELCGYHVHGTDDGIGSVVDFLVDDVTWAIRYLVVDTGHFGWGKKVLLAPQWATRISFDLRQVFVGVARDVVHTSPPWDETAALDRAYEERLYGHYQRAGYWSVDNDLGTRQQRRQSAAVQPGETKSARRPP
jgi:hypothetical protein